jgi:hypothetical protein
MKQIGQVALGLAMSLFLASAAWAIEVTEAVHHNYKAYMFHIGAGRLGAFAVNLRGDHSSFVYCTDATCDADQAASAALEKCRALSGGECQLMAYNKEVRIPFTVISGEKAGDETLAEVLDADRLKQVVVGNTLQGEYPNGRKWSEYYDASGEIRGRDDDQGTYLANYTFNGNEICFDYAGTFDDWCGQISLRGNHADFLKDGELQTFMRNTILLDGNPNNL